MSPSSHQPSDYLPGTVRRKEVGRRIVEGGIPLGQNSVSVVRTHSSFDRGSCPLSLAKVGASTTVYRYSRPPRRGQGSL